MGRDLAALRDALRGGALARAMMVANQLDRHAGPHIEFEQSCLYPILEKRLGKAMVQRLYHEHEVGRDLLRALYRLPPDARLSTRMRERLAEKAEAARRHAVGCSEALTPLDDMDEDRQSALSERLRSSRSRQTRWTQLPLALD